MNFTITDLRILIERFIKHENEIKKGIAADEKEKIQQKENEILSAYNEIIRYAYPIWQNTDKKLKEHVKSSLIDIYYRLKSSLDLLKSSIELPTYLIEEIKLNENKDKKSNTNDQQTSTSKPFETLNEFYDWDSKNTSKELKNTNSSKMTELSELRTLIEQMQLTLKASEEKLQTYEKQIETLNQKTGIEKHTAQSHKDIETQITSGDQIQLETFRAIQDFAGDRGQYRSWRNQVTRQMSNICHFKTHPKYGAALGIIRAKITGPASDVLTNNKTPHSIEAYIHTLDSTYIDQRPLYIVKAEMVSITQSNKSLQEFYNSINQALNMVKTKISATYTTNAEPMIKEAELESIRTFILGLKSQSMRTILYGNKPETLAEAYTLAQTIYYDNKYLQLDQQREAQRHEYPKNPQRQQQRKFPGNFYTKTQTTQNSPNGFNMNMNCNQPQQQQIQPRVYKPQQISTDESKQMNWRQKNPQPTTQNKDYQRNYQQQNKYHKINQLQNEETIQNDENEEEISEEIPDDLISISSQTSSDTNVSSAFLDA